jgi:ubiquinone/menaquinone biosynthesis C-methylase UbiE
MTKYDELWDIEVEHHGTRGAAIGDNPEEDFFGQINVMKQFLKEPILDAGCGYGRLLTKFNNITGVDISTEMLKEAEKSGKKTFKCSVSDLNIFADGSFNSVICDKVLMHLKEEDMKKALLEFNRVLKPKGRIFITVPSSDDIRGMIFHIRVKLHLFNVPFNSDSYEISPRLFSENQMIDYLKDAGFDMFYSERDDFGLVLVGQKTSLSSQKRK